MAQGPKTGRTTAKKPAPKKAAVRDRARKATKTKTEAKKAAPAPAATRTSKWQPRSRAEFVSRVAGGTRRAADLLDIAPSQASRWARGESVPGPAQARMLVDLDHVLAHALLVWADDDVALDWLSTPNAHLDRLRPVDWIRRHGTAEVVNALRAEAAGAYA